MNGDAFRPQSCRCRCKWLRAWSPEVARGLATVGALEALCWSRESNLLRWDSGVCSAAAESGAVDVLQYAIQAGCHKVSEPALVCGMCCDMQAMGGGKHRPLVTASDIITTTWTRKYTQNSFENGRYWWMVSTNEQWLEHLEMPSRWVDVGVGLTDKVEGKWGKAPTYCPGVAYDYEREMLAVRCTNEMLSRVHINTRNSDDDAWLFPGTPRRFLPCGHQRVTCVACNDHLGWRFTAPPDDPAAFGPFLGIKVACLVGDEGPGTGPYRPGWTWPRWLDFGPSELERRVEQHRGAAAAAPAPAPPFAGVVVVLKGLVAAAEHNGKRAAARSFDPARVRGTPSRPRQKLDQLQPFLAVLYSHRHARADLHQFFWADLTPLSLKGRLLVALEAGGGEQLRVRLANVELAAAPVGLEIGKYR